MGPSGHPLRFPWASEEEVIAAAMANAHDFTGGLKLRNKNQSGQLGRSEAVTSIARAILRTLPSHPDE